MPNQRAPPGLSGSAGAPGTDLSRYASVPSGFSGDEIVIAARPISRPLRITRTRLSAALTTTVTGPAGDLSGSQRKLSPDGSRGSAAGAPFTPIGARTPGCETSLGAVASLAITTVIPTVVTPKRSSANADGRCTQPCDSGYPGIPPAWSATPSQVSRSE